MHATSLENMQRCIDWYMPSETKEVIDLGAADVNGSYRSLFPEGVRYTGVDLAPGPGVDVVQRDPYVLPFGDASADAIITGQMLEHCAHFWRVFEEIARVLRPGGVVFAIAPSAGPVHRYPVDCWRYYPDSFPALAEWSGLRLVHSWTDERGPWRDLVGVFQKGGALQMRTTAPGGTPFVPFERGDEPVRARGLRPYLDVLRDIHDVVAPRTYLEIGVRSGASLRLSQAEVSIGIDPSPDDAALPDRATIYRCTSDDFFFFHAQQDLKRKVDLAFIDGMHLAEFVLRDFMNVEAHMSPNGVIVVDDVLPLDATMAARERETAAWTGDVWRFVDLLRTTRRDLRLTLLDAAPTGLLMISRVNAQNRTLWTQYNPLMRTFDAGRDAVPPPRVIERHGALPPTVQTLRQELRSPPVAGKPQPAAQTAQEAQVPDISLVVGAYNMARELPRTLSTLSRQGQREAEGLRWDVTIVDNGSTVPVAEAEVKAALGDVPFRIVRTDAPSASPAAALNAAVAGTRGKLIGLWIDGARLASPGILARAHQAWKADPTRVVATLAFHLGPDQQMRSVPAGYDREAEDRLLGDIPWRDDGYRLFDVAVLAGSSERGWFGALAETNAAFLDRALWQEVGGLDTRFSTSGGGFVNLDFWSRCLVASRGQPWTILGEGTFHQVHGGAATNGSAEARREMAEEYRSIHGAPFEIPSYTARFIGDLDQLRLRAGTPRGPR